MAERSRRRASKGRLPYWVTYGLTAGVLLAITGSLVLIVLPSRYALVADLRESGISFPTSADAIAFLMPGREPLIEPPQPPPPPVEPVPGPAERLWSDIDPLLAAHDYRAALTRMDAYLERYPDDVSVRRERARTLVQAGRPAAARAAFEELVRRTGAPSDRRGLARVLRDAGDIEPAVALYRGLLAERPDDDALRHELASLYMWSERYAEAEVELRRLIAGAPGVGRYRLDLARVLYWAGRPEDARGVLAALPSGGELATEAAALDRELARVIASRETEPAPLTVAQQAREAAAAEDLTRAGELYAQAVAESPGDSALARERIDFLQYRLADLDGAIAALEAYRDRFGLDADGRYRLAELYVWTGREAEARPVLEALVRDHPDRAEAWGLLGDVYRYADERADAREAYERAVALEPGETHAAAGLVELDRLRTETVAAREPAGYGPAVSLFTDSDDFLRLDLAGSASWTGSRLALDLTAGYRRLEGRDLAGLGASDQGGFASLEAASWWSEASLRTAARLGVDALRGAGTEPLFGLSIAKFGRSGSSISARYDHGPAYPLTSTLESAVAEVAADHVEVAAYTPLGEAWALSGTADVAWLSGGGLTNTRWGAGAALSRRFGPWLTADAGSRVVGFADPSPVSGRRLYWDPNLFWSNTVGLTVGHAPERGLGFRLRLSGGAAWADERDVPEAEWIPQYGLEAGLSWLSEPAGLNLSTFYRRGREDGYESFGAALTLRVTP